MPYRYTAYTADKKISRGIVDVASESLAEEALYRAGFQNIISLQKMSAAPTAETLLPSLFGIKPQDIIDFSNQTATLLESGISIITALQLLEEQAAKVSLRKIITGLMEDVQGGATLSQALGKYPQAFPDTYRQLITASEQAGNLENGLKQAAAYLENQAATRQKIQRAMYYPIFVIILAVAVSVLLILVALPPLVGLFDSFGAELPWATRLLMGIADFIIAARFYLLGALILIILLFIVLRRLPAGQAFLDDLALKTPVIGNIVIERNMQQFCQITSMLLKAGLRLPQVMDIVTRTIRNRGIRRALVGVGERLIQGEGLAQPLAENPLFPRLMAEMALVGEKTGTIDTILGTLGNFYDRRVDRRVASLIAMIEPTLTVIVGVIVIFIALSMITPLYSILGSLS